MRDYILVFLLITLPSAAGVFYHWHEKLSRRERALAERERALLASKSLFDSRVKPANIEMCKMAANSVVDVITLPLAEAKDLYVVGRCDASDARMIIVLLWTLPEEDCERHPEEKKRVNA